MACSTGCHACSRGQAATTLAPGSFAAVGSSPLRPPDAAPESLGDALLPPALLDVPDRRPGNAEHALDPVLPGLLDPGGPIDRVPDPGLVDQTLELGAELRLHENTQALAF